MDAPVPVPPEEPLANNTFPEMAVMIAKLEEEIIKAGGGEERIGFAIAAEQEEGCGGSINERKMLQTIAKDYRLIAMRAVRTFFNLDKDRHEDLIDELTEHAIAFSQFMVYRVMEKPTKNISVPSFGISTRTDLDAFFASVDVCTPDQGRKSDL